MPLWFWIAVVTHINIGIAIWSHETSRGFKENLYKCMFLWFPYIVCGVILVLMVGFLIDEDPDGDEEHSHH